MHEPFNRPKGEKGGEMITKIFSYILVGLIGVAVIAFLAMSVHVLYMDLIGIPTWEIQEKLRWYLLIFSSPIAACLIMAVVGGIAAKVQQWCQRETNTAHGARKAER